MSPSLGFTALTLFSTLRFPLSQLPEMITLLITCRTSLRRIRDYLITCDLPGLPALPPQGAPKGSIIVQNLTAAWRRAKKEEDTIDDKGGKKMICCNNFSQTIRQSIECLEKGGMGTLCCFTKRPESVPSSSYKPPSSSSRSGTRYSKLLDEEADADIESPLDNTPLSDRGQRHPEQDIHVIVKNVSLRIQPGSLNVIIGATGAGKSSLLSAVLGETLILSGERYMVGEVAYSTQTAWIQNETLRDNILFGAPFDPTRCLAFCSLSFF
ncbi:ATP-binding cassette domain-containing protein [archaeon]|nr:MAG: ATP-binding cassette domain-containing protein [archaeon]